MVLVTTIFVQHWHLQKSSQHFLSDDFSFEGALSDASDEQDLPEEQQLSTFTLSAQQLAPFGKR